MRRFEHLPGEEADCRPDPFSAGGKQMLQGGAQIGMGVIRLVVQEILHLLEARLDGREKERCIQPFTFFSRRSLYSSPPDRKDQSILSGFRPNLSPFAFSDQADGMVKAPEI